MRVALLHNPAAGGKRYSTNKLQALLRRAGHDVIHLVSRVADLSDALHANPCDLVVVAGGDGTVGRTACQISSWGIPLGILPLGTANNTARALGLPSKTKSAAASWHEARPIPFDLGAVSDGVSRLCFSEAIGWGVFVQAIEQAKRSASAPSVRRTLQRDRKLFRAAAREAPARHYRVEVDGRDLSGWYVLVEVMNVPLLGPQLLLSAKSDPSDGLFEIVLATEAERPLLEAVTRSGEPTEDTPLRIERGRRVRVEASDGVLHRDGRLWRHAPGPRSFEIDVRTQAIHYLR